MTMTGEIRILREGWLVRASIALTRWSRRRRIRADISEIYYGEEAERRATLKEQLLLDRERNAARYELDRITAMSSMHRGLV
jgi:hypothetical protein